MIITNIFIISGVLGFIALRVLMYLVTRPSNLVSDLTTEMPDKEVALHSIKRVIAFRIKARSSLYVVALCLAILIALLVITISSGMWFISSGGYNYQLSVYFTIAVGAVTMLFSLWFDRQIKIGFCLLRLLERQNNVSYKLVNDRIIENKR